MSGFVNKVKEAIHPHHHESTDPANSESITKSSHISPTNPGVLSSTHPGIHGLRDSGTATSVNVSDPAADSSRLTPSTWGLHAGDSVAGPQASVAHGDSISPTNPGVLSSTKPGIHGLRDSGTGVTAGFEEVERRGSQLHAEAVKEAVRHGGFGGAPGGVPQESRFEEVERRGGQTHAEPVEETVRHGGFGGAPGGVSQESTGSNVLQESRGSSVPQESTGSNVPQESRGSSVPGQGGSTTAELLAPVVMGSERV